MDKGVTLMKKLGLHEIRQEFLNFFNEKDHLVVPSYSLVPIKDKSLLLINAGMAPLKPYFQGAEKPPKERMATCQKCMRTGDIDNVGRTSRHGTFFEMLGNYSFGDYFKEEAIKWAWEFMTEKMGISPDILWVSVYLDDDETYNIWKNDMHVSEDRIVRLGKEDNFWEMEIGPCGPCSEIYVDRGEEYGCGSEDCKPGCDCDRYVEVWNLVFSQYDKDEDGNYNPLPNPNIDTGMGLERIALISQRVENIFETDAFKIILDEVVKISGIKYGVNTQNDMSIRIITDHIRSMTFLVSDGLIPSNEGRGYVLRRLIRRAARHGKLLGIKGNFLYKLSEAVINQWGNTYSDIKEKQSQIEKVIRIEEEKFQETIDQGINILNEYIVEVKKHGKTVLEGKSAFKLYDTFGFPLDLTKEILIEEGLTVDEEGFSSEMEKQKQRARSARQEGGTTAWDSSSYGDLNIYENTEFLGYNRLSLKSKVISLMKDNSVVKELKEGEDGIVVLDKTAFYGESGGQTGDKGILLNDNSKVVVNDTKKEVGDVFLHIVTVKKGVIKIGDIVEAKVDEIERINIARNHSVTHILHKVLKEVLGEHVNQAGSLVMPERLRFDFSHFEGLTENEVNIIEQKVNDIILQGLDVETLETSLEEARKLGVVALFDEKYGSVVRVVKIGEYSKELCGGTHVNNSSNIGLFKIISESGIASGVRRIEAITGQHVYKYLKNMESQIYEVAEILKTNKTDIIGKVKQLSEESRSLIKELDKLKSKFATSKLDDIVNEVIIVEGVNVIAKSVDGMDANNLRQLGDRIKNSMESVVLVLGTANDDKVNLIAMASNDLVSRGIHAGNIIREVAKITGGGGGGKPDMAQAGGKDPSKLQEALNKVKDLVKDQIKG